MPTKVQITVSDKLADHNLMNTGIVERLQKRKHLQNVLVRHCMSRGLRFFIREEIGHIQHVAWLGKEEVLEWTNSPIESHLHWKKGNGYEGTIQKQKVSSRIHKRIKAVPTNNTDGVGKQIKRKTRAKPRVSTPK